MPPSRFVRADRLPPLLAFLAVAVAVLLLADGLVRGLGLPGGVLRVVVVTWLVGVPLGGWLVWKRTGRGGRD